MKQVTCSNIYEMLAWIHANEHHESGHDFSRRTGKASHRYFRNAFVKMRISLAMPEFESFMALIEPNPRPHDDRMYALTRQGRLALAANNYATLLALHP